MRQNLLSVALSNASEEIKDTGRYKIDVTHQGVWFGGAQHTLKKII